MKGEPILPEATRDSMAEWLEGHDYAGKATALTFKEFYRLDVNLVHSEAPLYVLVNDEVLAESWECDWDMRDNSVLGDLGDLIRSHGYVPRRIWFGVYAAYPWEPPLVMATWTPPAPGEVIEVPF